MQRLQRRAELSSAGERARAVSQGHGRPTAGNHLRASDSYSRQHFDSSSSRHHEDLHESTAFSVKELSREYGDSSGASARSNGGSGRGDLSDAVQSALDAAAQLRQRSAASRADYGGLSSSQLSSSQYSVRVRSREDSAAVAATPPRDKKVAASSPPTSVGLSTGRLSTAGSHSYGHAASPATSMGVLRTSTAAHIQPTARAVSAGRAMGGISSFSSARDTSFSSTAESSSAVGAHTYRRKVKATVRRNN